MVSVTVNSRGDSHTTSSVKKAGLPFKKLLKTYIRPGLRELLRYFDKLENDEIVCASYTTEQGGIKSVSIGMEGPKPKVKVKSKSSKYAFDKECREILDFDYSEFIKIKNKPSTLQGDSVHKIYNIDEQIRQKYPQIKNINAIELYARAIDYHFTGYGESVMKVLIAIPAFIFDQVPEAPDLPDVDVSAERLFISPRRLHTDITRLKEVLLSFSQYQAFFYRYQNGTLYFKDTETTEESDEAETSDPLKKVGKKFYIKFYVKRLELFENALEKLLKQNGFTYSTFLNRRTSDMPWRIKFVFDKSDEKRPFTLKRVGVKIEGCYYKKLGKGLSSFLKKGLIQDQTLMGLIANIKDIRSDLDARETPGWLDFCLKYIYPNLGVNYGSKDKYKEQTAVNCLGDKLGLNGIDDFVHNAVGEFTDLFAYQFNKNQCRALGQKLPEIDLFDSSGGIQDKYIDEWYNNKYAKIGEPSILEEMLKDIKSNWDNVNKSEDKLKNLMGALNPCNFFQLGLKAIQCLMSGMSFEASMRIMAKKALSTMASDALEKVMEALPYDKQEEIRKMVEDKFGNMPAPWEQGYKPGSFDKVIDKRTADGIASKEKAANEMLDNQSDAVTKMKELNKRVEELATCLENPNICTRDGKLRPPPPPVVAVYPPLTYVENMRRGDQGASVTALQVALVTLGHKLVPDGDFGKITRNALKAYQRSAKILVDGIAGPQTRGSINSALAAKAQAENDSEAPNEDPIVINKPNSTEKQVLESSGVVQGSTDSLYGDILKELMDAHKQTNTSVQNTERELKEDEQKLENLKGKLRSVGEEQEQKQKDLEAAKAKMRAYMNQLEIDWFDYGGIKTMTAWQKVEVKDLQDKIDEALQATAKLEQDYNKMLPGIEYLEKRILKKAAAVKAAYEKRTESYDTAMNLEKMVDDKIKELQGEWFTKRTELQLAMAEQAKKYSANDTTLNEESGPYANWNDLSEDERTSLTARERNKHDDRIMKGVSPDDPDFEQGTYGKALGDIQSAVTSAYVEAIMETAELQQLMGILNKLPGVKLIGSFLAGLKCPLPSFIYPPLSSFLGTLTLDPCGPGKTRISFGELPKLRSFNGWNFLNILKNAFVDALLQVVTEIMFAIIFKLASIVFDVTCQTLAAAGQAAFKGIVGDSGWRNAVDDFFCGKDKPEDERDDHAALVLKTAVPQIPGDAKDLAKTMSVIGTKSEYARAITSLPEDQDMGFMKNLSSLIVANHPEYALTMGTPEMLVMFFSQVGNLLTADQIVQLRDSLDFESEIPLDDSICLTDDELDQWAQDREDALTNAGLDPQIAKDFVARQDERRKSDLADIADILSQSPEGMLENALNEALGASDPDPGCDVSKSAVQLEKIEQVKDAVGKATKGMFKRLEKAFFDDIILWRWPMDPRSWNDTPGILSTILADTQGYTLNFHNIARNNIFFKTSNFVTFGFYPKYEEYPETVGIKFREALLETSFKSEGTKTKIPIKYDITDDYSWKSVITLTDEFKETNDLGQEVYPRAFDYKFKQKSPENILGTFRVEKPLGPDNKDYQKYKLLPSNGQLGKSDFRGLVMKNLLNNWVYKDFNNVDIDESEARSLMSKLQNIVNTKFVASLMSVDGNIPSGFLHGSKNQEIKAEHLEYVAPDGAEYDFEETDAVFGRAKSGNGRVKFLDPAKYGGDYTSPSIYISPPKDEGLMQIARVFVPHISEGCNPDLSKSHFLKLDQIKEIIDAARAGMKPHKKLEFSPECVREFPFDKIASPATLASLEGVVIATIRVYLADFFAKTMPIWSSISLVSLVNNAENYDELLPEYIVMLMKRGLSSEKSIFSRATYEAYPYWLLFLEQAAQVVQRRVKNGSIEETTDIKEAFDTINELQNQHVVASPKDLILVAKSYDGDVKVNNFANDYLAESIVKGGALIGGVMERGELPSGTSSFGSILWSAFGLKEARFSAKMWTLHRGRKAAMTLLKYLVIGEINEYQLTMAKKLHEMNNMPHFNDLGLSLIGKHGAAVGKAPESGIWATTPDSEGFKVPPETRRKYGDVNSVSSNPLERHSIESAKGKLPKVKQEDFDFMKENGALFLEKYIRLFDRTEESSTKPIPDFIKNRPNHLKGVVNISDFKKFLNDNKDSIPADIRISDWFMAKEIAESEENKPAEYEDIVGIKYGVRLCYIPDEDFRPFSLPNTEDNNKAILEKSFKCKPISFEVERESTVPGSLSGPTYQVSVLEGSKNTFPIEEIEQEIPDTELIKLIEFDDDLNQELRCYVDRLTLGTRFDLIFHKTLHLKRITSLLMISSYDSWVPSIGAKGSKERIEPEIPEAYEDMEDDPPSYSDPGGTPYFNDSRKECRKLFIANYKRSDYDPKDEEEDFDPIKDNVQQMMSNTFSAVSYGSDVPFWMKWRVLKENPDDKEGNACGNQFTKLFKKTEEEE